VPDFPVDTAPTYRPPPDARAAEAIGGDEPFIMQADGRAWLHAPAGLLDGPMPTHYEPQESPVPNALYPAVRANPARQEFKRPDNPYHPPPGSAGAAVFPFVFTTFRVTEHHTAGGMSRWTPYLNELMPEMFLEVSPELAALRGLRNGQWCHVVTARSAIEGKGAGHRARQAAARGRHHDPPDRRAVALGVRRAVHRRRRQRAAVRHARPERAHHGDEGRHVRHPAGPQAARPDLVAFLADYRRRAGLED
jgi:formate dehydrogenase major subunit